MKKSATVYWFDSAIFIAEGFYTQSEVEKLTPCDMVSAGIIAHETDKFIILAKDLSNDLTYRGVSLIPKCNITKIIKHR